MSLDLDIQRTIEAGKRNLEAKQLIHNWCRHARVEKFGGTGLIEIETGLPIGHHAMVCDYAAASGMATWLLEEAALHFHDANCAGCTKREYVGLPNISKLLAQRERDAELARARTEDLKRKKEAALFDRSLVRSKLRETLPIPASTFIDDLQTFDAERSESAESRLIESARLASEILVPELVEHLFLLLESDEHWFDKIGFTIFSAHAVDQGRLTRCAMRCLATGHAIDISAEIVINRISHVDVNDVAKAVAGLAYVASPPRSEFSHAEPERGNPAPLARIAERFPEETSRGLDTLLANRDPFRVGVAARAIGSLISTDARWPNRFLRSLAAQLSKADIVFDVDSDSELRRIVHDLTKALANGFLADPELADSELMRQFESASSDGESRLVGVYDYVVRRGGEGRGKSAQIVSFEPYEVAFRRFVALAGASENHGVVQHVLSALRHPKASLAPVAKELMDLFLGTAALLDSKLQSSLPESPLVTPPDPLSAMEQANRRSNLWNLRRSFIALAVQGARVDLAGLAAFEIFLGKRSALGDSLEAAIIQEISPLMEASAGLRAVLPYLYGAMVGPSTLARAAAAKAIEGIGSLRFAELPSLVAEALLMMLFDPYVIVHKAAVSALRRISLPDSFSHSVSAALDNLISAYRGGDDQEFLLECIEAFGRGKRDDTLFAVQEGTVLVALLSDVKPSLLLRSGHYYFVKTLCHVEGYLKLVLSLFPHCQTDYEIEHALELAQEFPLATTGNHLTAIIEAIACDPSDVKVCGTFIELLTRDGEWEGAVQVAKMRTDAIADTPRESVTKLIARQLQWRAEFEHLLSKGQLDEAFSVGKAWQTAEREITEIREQNEKSDPFRSILHPTPS